MDMIKKEYKHSEITGKVIGCAMEVPKRLGNGFQEVIYQRALEIEMGLVGLQIFSLIMSIGDNQRFRQLTVNA